MVGYNLEKNFVYVLGCLIFELVAHHAPFESPDELCYPEFRDRNDRDPNNASSLELQSRLMRRYDRVLNSQIKVPGVSAECAYVLRCMLCKDPDERPSMAEVCSFPWFSKCLDPVYADTMTRPPRLRRRRRQQDQSAWANILDDCDADFSEMALRN